MNHIAEYLKSLNNDSPHRKQERFETFVAILGLVGVIALAVALYLESLP